MLLNVAGQFEAALSAIVDVIVVDIVVGLKTNTSLQSWADASPSLTEYLICHFSFSA